MTSERRRFPTLHALPLLLVFAWVAYPLARGSETLFLRDVFNAHLEMKWAQAEALKQGTFPVIDPYRAGGQPLAGNPNAVPFYPDNLLYRLASPIWALNAHFWLHLLLAPFAFAWLARAWGLDRQAAWAAAALYAASGFFLSHLAFYNLIAGATLAPAFAAAALDLTGARGRRRPWTLPALALLWALLLLGGDPLMAALALFLAMAALVIARVSRGGSPGLSEGADADLAPAPEIPPSSLPPARRGAHLRSLLLLAAPLLAALAVGTLLAAPQIVEFLRILPLSFRGYWGYTPKVATVASWDPRQALEWFLPFVFGRPDLLSLGRFWGERFFTGVPPYYLSLYPGLLALALVGASGRPRSVAARWAWAVLAIGIFFSLGRFNPLADRLFGFLGGGALRYPVKLWMPVAVGASLLGGIGFARVVEGEGRKTFGRLLLALAGLYLLAIVFLTLRAQTAFATLRRLVPASFEDAFVDGERARWAALAVVSLLVLAGLGLATRLLRRRPAAGGALLLAVHALSQIYFLRPAFPTDAAFPYQIPPPGLRYLPQGQTVVHGAFARLFGPSNLIEGTFPEPRMRWVERRAFYELYPMTGPQWHRRYELDVSPEGLDSFLTRVSQGALKGAGDPERVRLLAAWGVGRLLLDRALDPRATGAHLLARLPSFGHWLHVYAIENPAPEVYLARRTFHAPHLSAAYQAMADPRFDTAQDVVVPGEGPSTAGPGGTVHVLARGPETLEADVSTPAAGLLVVQRANLPLYRAEVDGHPVETDFANLQKIAIPIPAGRHRVHLWIDRRPFHLSLIGVGLGLLGLCLLPLSRFAPRSAGAGEVSF